MYVRLLMCANVSQPEDQRHKNVRKERNIQNELDGCWVIRYRHNKTHNVDNKSTAAVLTVNTKVLRYINVYLSRIEQPYTLIHTYQNKKGGKMKQT